MSNEPSSMKEVQWTDDVIRWQGGLGGNTRNEQELNDNDDDSDDGCLVDPFADPDPTELNTFSFVLPPHSTNMKTSDKGLNDEGTIIDVIIKGYKTGSDAVWKSTGLTLWKASHYLCEYQIENGRVLFENKRVLELGAGLGLNGILCWKIMCALQLGDGSTGSVCITDGDSDALVHLRENIQRNQSMDCNNTTPQVICHQLLWGSSTSQTFLGDIAQHKRYDTIIASDIIYAPSIIEPLWETIETMLDKDGVFVMAFARRKVPVSIELVLEAAVKHKFGYDLVKEDKIEGIWVYVFRYAEV